MGRGLKAIFFDLDDTLLVTDAPHREAVTASCAEAARRCPAIDPGRLEAVYLEVAREMWRSFDLPQMQEVAVEVRRREWAAALQRVGWRDAALTDAVAAHYSEGRRIGYRLFPGALDTLQRLHGRYHLGMITNGLTEIQREKIDCLGIEPVFDSVIISQQARIAKPDAGIFQLALNRVPCEPWEAVMIGDSLERDIAGARAAGLHTLWMRLGRSRELWPGPSPGRRGETGSAAAEPQTAHAVLDSLQELLPWLENLRS